ncbi:MAG: DUF5803 family protein [Methanothrix sp.]|uniref:DUF5803 family protein n=1 Tax=Methanothrix sp. TaxID=90426 RepID=UPI0025FD4C59|nr:DUF5803 family protein [Methanothrix sp.]MCQ8903575.1 DUF5803 family protein [Methanothrix sp.]
MRERSSGYTAPAQGEDTRASGSSAGFDRTVLFALAVSLLILTSGSRSLDLNNATVVDLAGGRAVIEQPVSGKTFNITAIARIENISVMSNSNVVRCSVEESFWRGVYRYRIASDEPVSGILRYEAPMRGQQFVSPVLLNGTVAVMIPEGYTTGARALGIPRPGPYEIIEGNRTAVVWRLERDSIIEVGFYRNDAPQILGYFFVLLLAAGIFLAAGYYSSIRRLEAMRRGLR